MTWLLVKLGRALYLTHGCTLSQHLLLTAMLSAQRTSTNAAQSFGHAVTLGRALVLRGAALVPSVEHMQWL